MTEWFLAVKQRKEAEARDRKAGKEPLEEVPMWENELAKGWPGG